jgi:hypothetical protein
MIPKLPSPIFLPTLNLFPTTVNEVPLAVSEEGLCAPPGAVIMDWLTVAMGAVEGPGFAIYTRVRSRRKERKEKTQSKKRAEGTTGRQGEKGFHSRRKKERMKLRRNGIIIKIIIIKIIIIIIKVIIKNSK